MTASTKWTGKAGTLLWGDAGNWSAGVPQAGLNALFSNAGTLAVALQPKGGTAIDAAGTLSLINTQLTLTHGQLQLAPAFAPKGATYDATLAQGAGLTIARGASLSGSQTMLMGRDGSATQLNIQGTLSEDYLVDDAGRINITKGGHFQYIASGMVVGGGGVLAIASGGRLDGGPNGLSQPAARLTLGDGLGRGTATISGAASRVNITNIEVGSGYSGTLSISGGAVVNTAIVAAGEFGDARVSVSGVGSQLNASSDILIGGAVPVAATLSVIHGGSVNFGTFGLILDANLVIDGSAKLSGASIIDGGEVQAVAGAGPTAVIGSDIAITNNWLFSNQVLAAFSADAGVTLRLDGAITGGGTSVLQAGSGHVLLTNAANAYATTNIYAADLEVHDAHALGGSAIAFIGGSNAASLTLDHGHALSNVISGFGVADTIDLRDFAFDAAITQSWSAPSASGAETLTLNFGGALASLVFSGAAAGHAVNLTADAHGGTVLHLPGV